MIKVEELEKQLKTTQLKSTYLFYGEEVYLLENMVKKIKKIFGELVVGINYIVIDDTNVQNLIPEIEVPAFGYERKLIIVKNSGLFKKEQKKKNTNINNISTKIDEYILQKEQTLEENCVLVFIEEMVEKNELFNIIDKHGIVCNFEKLKPIQLTKKLKSICEAYKVRADEQVLDYLIQCIGISMQDNINEIRKLIEYAGENGIIRKEDIDELCIKKTDSIIFDLTDYLGSKNTKYAINTLKELTHNKEPIQKILTMIYNHFKKLYFVKLSEKYGKKIEESLSLKPNQLFLISKYKKQASYFTEQTLRELLQELTNLDYKYKIGLIDLEIGLESTLCNYCS